MSIREIPKSYLYGCDRCNTEHHQENAHGHYTNSTPPGWYRFTANSDRLGKIMTLLCCPNCGEGIALDLAAEGRAEIAVTKAKP